MEIFRGISVSHGVAIGPALLLDVEGVRIPQRRVQVDQVPGEISRFQHALLSSAAESRQMQQSISARLGKHHGAIFAAHALLFEDPALVDEVLQLIRSEHFSAEYAVSRVIRTYVKTLESLGANQAFALRAADLYDVEKRVLKHLLGEKREQLQNLTQPVIVLGIDLSPSETASLDPKKVVAFATEHGGRASHTAILANALEIPAVVGIGRFLHLAQIAGGDTVIVDGTQGLLILDPDEETLQRYQSLLLTQQTTVIDWSGQRDLPAETKDGFRVRLLGNIEFPSETAHCIDRGAEGIGLYRTEFLYLGRDRDPTEEEHFQAYMAVINEMGNERPIVIRTLDLGADKFAQMVTGAEAEKNPSLGLRSVRLCLRNLTLFRTQLRAILRASAFGNIRMMFPMVGTLQEIRQCRMLLEEVKEDLQYEGIAFHRDIPVGTMIEVPSAALMADYLAREVDFFSIGTNDLVQYTLAADRTNENVANLYNPADPAVLRLIQMVVEAAQKHNVEVNVCGEMSGDPLFTSLLVGLGICQLSATAHNLPEIKRTIRLITRVDAQRIAAEALTLETAQQVTNYLRDQLQRLLPEAVD